MRDRRSVASVGDVTERLARASSRRPWLVVGLWLTVILTSVVLVAMFLAFEGEAEVTRQTETKQAERILSEGFPQDAANEQETSEVVIVRAEDGDVTAAAARARVAALADELRARGLLAWSRTARSGTSSRRIATRRRSSSRSAGTGRMTSTELSMRFSASMTSRATPRGSPAA